MPHRTMTERVSLPDAELRVSTEVNGDRNLQGLIPYNSRSVDLGGFTEEIAPGAFAEALQAGADVLCLRDHKQELLLGRTRARTFALSASAEGLRWKVKLPNTTYAQDLAESVGRGDLDTNSFGFICAQDGDKWSGTRGNSVRTLTKVELLEISPCSFAAYPPAPPPCAPARRSFARAFILETCQGERQRALRPAHAHAVGFGGTQASAPHPRPM